MAYLGDLTRTVPQPRSRARAAEPAGGPWVSGRPDRTGLAAATRAVLFGRDGTLLQDVACNGDPALVHPMAGIRATIASLRGAGFALGVLSNQPGVARGLIDRRQVELVQARAEDLLGPLDIWAVCPHGPHDGCACRMPAPTLVLAACRELRLPPSRVTVIGRSDGVLTAALTAGAHVVRVPEPPRTESLPLCALTACRSATGPEAAAALLLRP